MRGFLYIVLEINGKKLSLGMDENGQKQPFGITKITGLGSSEYSVATSDNALVDGSTVNGKRILKRPISISASSRELDYCGLVREQLIAFFNPKYTGKLTVNRNGKQRNIEFEIEGFVPDEESTIDSEVGFTADLICPNPYFKNVDNFGQNMADKTRLFAFPWRISKKVYSDIPSPYKYFGRGKMGMAYRTLKTEVALTNDGDVETSVIIQFIAARGRVVNPCITNKATGKFMRIVVEMQEGDILEIDTDDHHQTIELNGVNTYQKIDKKSEPFKLAKGENYLIYDADEDYTNLDVNLYYTPLYLGV